MYVHSSRALWAQLWIAELDLLWVEPHGRGRNALDRKIGREREMVVRGFQRRQRVLADDVVKLHLKVGIRPGHRR